MSAAAAVGWWWTDASGRRRFATPGGGGGGGRRLRRLRTRTAPPPQCWPAIWDERLEALQGGLAKQFAAEGLDRADPHIGYPTKKGGWVLDFTRVSANRP
eukprot:COSAG01_NODE_4940_length_4608_cov_7.420936_9_plen_100_part_00